MNHIGNMIECSAAGTCQGEEELFVKSVDQNDIESVLTWGGCVFPPEYKDSDIVYYCGEYQIPWNGVCLVDVLRLLASGTVVADEQTCNNYGGSWVYPSEDQASCELSMVERDRDVFNEHRDVMNLIQTEL